MPSYVEVSDEEAQVDGAAKVIVWVFMTMVLAGLGLLTIVFIVAGFMVAAVLVTCAAAATLLLWLLTSRTNKGRM